MTLLLIGFLLFLTYVFCKIYTKLTIGWCKSQTCLVGKTAIITGANVGLGYETALDFAKRGARVILACRDERKAKEARLKIIEETGNQNIVVKLIDMASFESVRAFAEDINKTEARLDILVNNAGVLGVGDEKSKDGNLLLMQVNHFSSFLLTNLLISLLKKSTPSRVVNVSSLAAQTAFFFSLKNINKSISNQLDYANSKLCNILFTIELSKKLQGTGVTTYSLHPGVVKTEIFRNLRGLLKLFYIILNLCSKTQEEGAQTMIYCSVAKGIEQHSGEYFVDCHKVGLYRTATNPGLPKKLWEKSEEIVQLKPEEIQF